MNVNSPLWLCEGVIAIVNFLTVLAIVLPLVGLAATLGLLVRHIRNRIASSRAAGPADRTIPEHLTSARSPLWYVAPPFRPRGIARRKSSPLAHLPTMRLHNSGSQMFGRYSAGDATRSASSGARL